MSNLVDVQYLGLLDEIITKGYRLPPAERQSVGTIQINNAHFSCDLRKGFPLLTTKKLSFKNIVTELLWFLRGDTNIKYLVDNGCNIWNSDAYKYYVKNHSESNGKDYSKNNQLLDEFTFISAIKDGHTEKWFDNKYVLGDLGSVYGEQWRKRASYSLYEPDGALYIYKPIDQISDLIDNIKSTISNNYNNRRLIVDAWNPSDLKDMALPPCFISGTKIATIDGVYKEIQDIEVGDKVLTINGTYQNVYELHKTPYDKEILNIRSHGSPYPISCTPNHPLLIRNKEFISANEVMEGDYLGINIPNIEENKTFDYSYKHGSSGKILNKQFKLEKEEEWYVLGYFLGNGWINSGKEDYMISIPDKKREEILSKINKCIPLAILSTSGNNVKTFNGKNIKWITVFKEFGKGAKDKKIPDFIFNGNKHLVSKFIEGYIDADGCKTEIGFSCTTISDNIAFGIQRLSAKIGKKVSLHYQIRPDTTIIEGRIVNQNNTYTINLYSTINNTSNFIIENNTLWMKIDSINMTRINDYVYNISVENNHTYTANNIINHNCHKDFQVILEPIPLNEREDIHERLPRNKKRQMSQYLLADDLDGIIEHLDNDNVPKYYLNLTWNQRSVDTFLGLPFNIASYGLLAHILGKLTNTIPKDLYGELRCVHLYENHIEQAKEQMRRHPYKLPTLNILLKDKWFTEIECIETWMPHDFDIQTYIPHPPIKADIVT